MKLRNGFVSNSSSSSFIITGHYSSCFEIALHMLKVRDDEWKSEELNTWDCKEYNLVKKSKLNPNTPIAFGTTNYDTFICRIGDLFYVDTCNNHDFGLLNSNPVEELDVEQFFKDNEHIFQEYKKYVRKYIDFKKFDPEYPFDCLKDSLFFWWPCYNIKARPTREFCEKCYRPKYELENGDIVCNLLSKKCRE